MKYDAICVIDAKVAKRWDAIIDNGEVTSERGILNMWTVTFPNDFEADINICGSESGPYIDAILFRDGKQVVVLEPTYSSVLGEYIFGYEGNEYCALLVPIE